MPIHFATEPNNGRALVQKGLDKLSARKSPLSGRSLDYSALKIQPPHAVYDLRADAVAAGGGLASATKTGIRYLVQGGDTHVAAAEVLTDASGAATLLTHINYGPFVEATARALQQVAGLGAVTKGSYEVRLLRFSAIALMALWLKPDSGGDDILYPLAPAPEGISANEPYSEANFLKVILPLAQKRVAKKEPSSVP